MITVRGMTLLILVVSFIGTAFGDDWELVWRDEFDGKTIDKKKWTHEITCSPANRELQCYTNREKNSRVENGKLIIEAHSEKYQNKKFTSARMRTRCDPKGAWLKGKFEMSAQLPKGSHLWPAFWMLSSDDFYGKWPRSGEIDIMEYRGQRTSQMSSALHYGYPRRSSNTGPMDFPGTDFSTGYHNFTFTWDDNNMKWYVNGKNTFSASVKKNWGVPYAKDIQPWDQRFHIILNMAVGGMFFDSYPALTDADVKKWSKPRMMVDYVRVYQRNGARGDPPIKGLPAICGDSNSVETEETKTSSETSTQITTQETSTQSGTQTTQETTNQTTQETVNQTTETTNQSGNQTNIETGNQTGNETEVPQPSQINHFQLESGSSFVAPTSIFVALWALALALVK